jgi:superfamily I DNA and/or RNA helicase
MPLGGFISENVYEGKLRSCHNIVDHSCVVFIDTEKGREEEQGKSYKASISIRCWLLEKDDVYVKQNTEEVHMAVRVAKRYHQRKLKFCIITFYDSQRAAITKALEIEKLPPGCVYNVDSFQGPFHYSCVNFSKCRP